MASVYLEMMADWYLYFGVAGLASFIVWWFVGADFFGGKLIVTPFFFLVLSMFGFLARKEKKTIVGV